jgi:hypothetical protein
MKPIIPFALLGALLAAGAASAATTTPVGYTTQALSQGFNAVGLTLHPTAVATGDFELTAGFGSTVTDSDTTFAPVAGRLYVLEINDGPAAGTIVEVAAASISGSTITTTTNLEALGVADGTKYSLRVAPTLEEVFTTTALASGGVLVPGLNSTNADVVWVPNGLGGYSQYFLHSGTSAFRIAGTTTPAPNVPIVYADGILVQKKTVAAASLTVTGEVKKVGTNTTILQGFNLIGTVAPAGLTLRTAGLEDDITAALNTTNADIIWIQQPSLAYKKYFRHTSGGGVWRDFDAPTVNLDPLIDPALNGAIYIQRKPAGAAAVDLTVPGFYSSL